MDAVVDIRTEKEYEEKYPLTHQVATTHCESAAEFIETLFDIKRCSHQRYIFRGQNQSHWGVIASLFRRDFLAKEAIDKSFEQLENPSDHLDLYYRSLLTWEHDVANGFANDCMNQGIEFPYVPHVKMRESAGLNNSFAFEDATYLVARNYGLPTRLVDFTYSPLVAAWFAVDGLRFTVTSSHPDKVVVWAINLAFLEKTSGWKTVSTSWANSQIPQMLRQKAVLLLDTSSELNFLATGKFQPLEYYVENEIAKNEELFRLINPIRRVTLPQLEDKELQMKLMCNFDLSEIYLFPTLDRIASHTLQAFSQHARVQARMHEIMKKDEPRRRESNRQRD